ncbi:phasin family protein [Legionella cardiaca]|uniref:phasin family protein n=1 Tax=Legionella cardiaca TaxID=1071983 RepID=UPI003B84AD6A
MNQQYLEQWSEIAKHIQQPFQAMLDLNVKTLRNFKFLKPEDLAAIKNPEEFIEKQVSIAIENGHKALDYFQQSFAIFEQTLQPLTDDNQRSQTVQNPASLTSPAKLAGLPAKTAMSLAESVLDWGNMDIFDPRKIMMEIANFSLPPTSSEKVKPASATKAKLVKKLKKH